MLNIYEFFGEDELYPQMNADLVGLSEDTLYAPFIDSFLSPVQFAKMEMLIPSFNRPRLLKIYRFLEEIKRQQVCVTRAEQRQT